MLGGGGNVFLPKARSLDVNLAPCEIKKFIIRSALLLSFFRVAAMHKAVLLPLPSALRIFFLSDELFVENGEIKKKTIKFGKYCKESCQKNLYKKLLCIVAEILN